MADPQLQPAPLRQPMFDASGNMTRPWLLYFQQLFVAGGQIVSNTETINDTQLAASFDDRNGVDTAALIEDALHGGGAESVRRFDAEQEAWQLLAQTDAARPTEPRLEEILTQASSSETNARALLTDLEGIERRFLPESSAPRVTPADLDEMRALWAIQDTAPLTNLAVVSWTGSYLDLSNQPTIPAAQVPSDWSAASGVAAILNKPTIPAAQVQSDWNASTGLGVILNKPTIPTLASLGGVSLTASQTISGSCTFSAGILGIGGGGAASSTFTASGLSLDAQWSNYAALSAGLKAVSGTLQYVTGNGSAVSRLAQEGGTLNYYTGTSTGSGNTASLSGVFSVTSAGLVTALAGFKSGSNVGVSGTLTIPKLTTGGSNGSLTFTGGLVTAFTNPT